MTRVGVDLIEIERVRRSLARYEGFKDRCFTKAEQEAIVLGKPSAAYFAAALDALEYEPEQTWMVGDDIESDVAGATAFGLRTILVRTGKFREEALDEATVRPDGVIDSIAALPQWLEDHQ